MTTFFPAWMKDRSANRTAVLAGASQENVFDFAFSVPADQLIIVCHRPLADAISMAAVLDGRIKPNRLISHGLPRDFDELKTDAQGQIVVIDSGPILTCQSTKKAAVMGSTRLLAGYDIDLDLSDHIAWTGVVRLFGAFRRHHAAPIILYDPKLDLPPAFTKGATVLLADKTQTWASKPAPKQPASNSVQTGIAPTQTLVAAHARFLAETELSTLCSMHMSMPAESCAELFEIWRRNIALLELGLEGREYVTLAVSKLIDVEAKLQVEFERKRR
jgi:hypothetical protein